ncbi:MAG: response regulator [Deltaproteobacteria bacterium]|nr:response regulator [Deltaproteobacteria bacterium]
MALRLSYGDRYRFWHDLVAGYHDRLFIQTDERPPLGERVPVTVSLDQVAVPVVFRALVSGHRRGSRRFPDGVWVRIDERELTKLRRFLGLGAPRGSYQPARHSVRAHLALPVRFVDPEAEEETETRNVSETGIFVATPLPLQTGQSVVVDLKTSPEAESWTRVTAEVAWASKKARSAGLRFIDPSPLMRAELNEAIVHALEGRLDRKSKHLQPILVADDDPVVLDLVKQALEKHGYEVHTASDGEEAFALIRELHPPLVLMDILMPEMDGTEICRAIRGDAELTDILVIFISALEAEALHVVAEESGATDYLPKPLHFTELVDMMGTYLRRDE